MNADTPLTQVHAGTILFLGYDPLLDDRRATSLFCEPQTVIAIHRGRTVDEKAFLRDDVTVVRAAGSGRRTSRTIGLEMTTRHGGRVLVLYPDDRHMVSAVNLPDPPAWAEAADRRRKSLARPVVDPTTGAVHDGRDLSTYRLPSFWRDASVIWSALPASWIDDPHRHSHLLLLEAGGGVRSPAPDDVAAAETLFHGDVAIGAATSCWDEATSFARASDGTLVAVFGPVLRRLVAAFGSADELRSAALDFVDAQLARSGADTSYLRRFFEEREAVAAEILARGDCGSEASAPGVLKRPRARAGSRGRTRGSDQGGRSRRAGESLAAAAASGFEIQRPPWWRDDREGALAEVAAEANRRVAGELADVLGPLSVVPRRHREDAFNGLCIRSEPLPAFGGAEFRLNTGSSSSDVPARLLAGDVAGATRRFWDSRDEVERIAREVGAAVDRVIGAGTGAHPSPRLVAIGVSPAAGPRPFRTAVTMEALGHDLTFGPEIIDVAASDGEGLRKELEALLAVHAARAALLAHHRANGSRGLIDQTARRMMEVSRMDLAFALDQLERCGVLRFRFDGGRMLGGLEWRDSVLRGEVNEPDNKAYVWEGSFTFWERHPETARAALVGRPLSAVADRPYLPVDAIISAVHDFGSDGTRLDLDIPTEPLPDAATRAWTDLS